MSVQRALSPTLEHITLGHALLHVQDPQFLRGYTSGYRQYCRYDVARPLSDRSICTMLSYQQHTDPTVMIWFAGYAFGWITATHGLPRVQHVCKPSRLAKGHPGKLARNR